MDHSRRSEGAYVTPVARDLCLGYQGHYYKLQSC